MVTLWLITAISQPGFCSSINWRNFAKRASNSEAGTGRIASVKLVCSKIAIANSPLGHYLM